MADITENAERIKAYLSGLDRDAFAANGLVRDAVERCLERICEAAHRLGDQAAVLMPTQPWADIRGMGNRLRHAYDRISLDDSGMLSSMMFLGCAKRRGKPLSSCGLERRAMRVIER